MARATPSGPATGAASSASAAATPSGPDDRADPSLWEMFGIPFDDSSFDDLDCPNEDCDEYNVDEAALPNIWYLINEKKWAEALAEFNGFDPAEVADLLHFKSRDDDKPSGLTVLHILALRTGHADRDYKTLCEKVSASCPRLHDVASTGKGFNPVHAAAFQNNTVLLKALLDNGSRPDALVSLCCCFLSCVFSYFVRFLRRHFC